MINLAMRSLVLISVAIALSFIATASPVPLSTFELEPAAGQQYDPAIAAGRDGFLVAWIDARDTFQGDLRATRLDAEGRVLDPEGILILSDELNDHTGISRPRIFPSGNGWLVVFSRGTELMVARVDEHGELVQLPRSVASGPETPAYAIEALAIDNRIVVSGVAMNGAAFVILDEFGRRVAGPTIVEPKSSARYSQAVLPAYLAGEVLLVDAAPYACETCPFMLVHRIRLDGAVLSRSVISGVERYDRRYALAPHGGGFLLVGQRRDALVEQWLLSADGTVAVSNQTISSTLSYSNTDTDLVLRPGSSGTELFYFAPRSPQAEIGLNRAVISTSSSITSQPFGAARPHAGDFAIAASPSRTVSVSTEWVSSYFIDLVAQVAPSTAGLEKAPRYDVAFSAPVQSDARVTRRGGETLVTWVESRGASVEGTIRATRLDTQGRPIAATSIELLDPRVSYSIASDGNEYLVAIQAQNAIRVRRLRADLTWRDAAWTTLVESSCGGPEEHGVAWSGGEWWLAWLSCGDYEEIVVRRFDRDLKPSGSDTRLFTEESGVPMLAPVDNAVIVLWSGNTLPCNICTCPPPVVGLLGARLSPSGSVLNTPIPIADGVQNRLLGFASRGSELLAIWNDGGHPSATRISRTLALLDTTYDSTGLHGEVLDDRAIEHASIGWDGSQWVVATVEYRYLPSLINWESTLRRFLPGDDLAPAWNAAATKDLRVPGMWVEGAGAIVSAAPGMPTLIIELLKNEETTGVSRYYVRNVSDSPRSRGTRR